MSIVSNINNNECQSFSPFDEYNLFTIGDVVQSDVDWQGRGAIGGNATLTNFGIGKNISPLPPKGTDSTLIVKGNLTWNGGTNFAGNTVMLPTTQYNVTDVSYPNAYLNYQPIRKSTLPIDFTKIYEYAQCLSKNLFKENSLGDTLILNCFGNIFLIGNSSDINISKFNANFIADPPNIVGSSGNSLNSISSLTILTPEDSTNILNISGTDIKFGDYSIFRNTSVPNILPPSDITGCNLLKEGVAPSNSQIRKILWNFYEATSITMSTISLQGSLLAPFAELKAVNGNIQGNVIVQSFMPNDGDSNNHTELHNFPFNGCLPNVNCKRPLNTTPSIPDKHPTPSIPDKHPIPTIPGRPYPHHKSCVPGKVKNCKHSCRNTNCLCCIKGIVWYDCNKNRCKEACEKGMENVIVDLYNYDDICISRTLTDSLGRYFFIDIDPGNYYLLFSNLNNEVDKYVNTGCFNLYPGKSCFDISLPI